MRGMLRSMMTFLAFLAGVFVLLCVFMYVKQDSLIFYPLKNDAALVQSWQKQRVEIGTGESAIEGWWMENPQSASSRIILYFGGNGEDVLYTAANSQMLHAARMLVTNYRGYGLRKGRPSQAGLFEDALAIYDHVARQPSVRPEDIVVMGRSLGSGVATYVAANRPVRAVILVTPYDSVAAVAKASYPFLPVGLLLKHPFPSDTFAPKIKAPALFIAADQDAVIPPAHAKRLAEVWGGEKTVEVLAGAGHNGVAEHPDYYRVINEFMDKL
jgi:pimeloyl-ACP methyl ester carboxylesterase